MSSDPQGRTFELANPHECSHPVAQRQVLHDPVDQGTWITCVGCGAQAQAGLRRPTRPAQPAEVAPTPSASPVSCECEGTPQCKVCMPSGPILPVDNAGPNLAVVRALAHVPPFLDQSGETRQLQPGDIVTVSRPVAELLVRRQKAVLVEVKP